ncbi:MAG: hypothetical protein R3279_06220 [Putridiphycobacter sp.]|nr:hypothetical protein [Putridiphycobacter sp.]
MKQLSILMILGAIFIACSPEKKYAIELEEINRYETSIDSLKDLYLTINFDSLIYIQKEAAYHEKMIKSYYMADTISIDLAQKLQYIKSIRKSLSNIQVKQTGIGREIYALKKQFENLEKDIVEGLLNKKQITEYLENEKKAYENLSAEIAQVLDNQSKQFEDFNFAMPVVHEYVEIIKPTEHQE